MGGGAASSSSATARGWPGGTGGGCPPPPPQEEQEDATPTRVDQGAVAWGRESRRRGGVGVAVEAAGGARAALQRGWMDQVDPGSGMDEAWIRHGSGVQDQAWNRLGSGMDQAWIRHGGGLDQAWIRVQDHQFSPPSKPTNRGSGCRRPPCPWQPRPRPSPAHSTRPKPVGAPAHGPGRASPTHTTLLPGLTPPHPPPHTPHAPAWCTAPPAGTAGHPPAGANPRMRCCRRFCRTPAHTPAGNRRTCVSQEPGLAGAGISQPPTPSYGLPAPPPDSKASCLGPPAHSRPRPPDLTQPSLLHT